MPRALVDRYYHFREMSDLKKKLVYFTEMLASSYKSAWCSYPEDKTLTSSLS